MEYTVALIAFHPITTALLKTTISRMQKDGLPIRLHDSDETPWLYLIDSDNEEACERWRESHPLLLAPVVFLGHRDYDLNVPCVSKPIRMDTLSKALMQGLASDPPRSSPRWRLGYTQPSIVFNPLASLVKPKVFVVDPSIAMRNYLALKLERHGVDVVIFDDAELTLQALDQTKPIAVFTEATLPGITGYALVRRIRTRFDGLPVVVLVSQAPSVFDKNLGRSAGAEFHLGKPLDENEVDSTMHKILSSWKRSL